MLLPKKKKNKAVWKHLTNRMRVCSVYQVHVHKHKIWLCWTVVIWLLCGCEQTSMKAVIVDFLTLLSLYIFWPINVCFKDGVDTRRLKTKTQFYPFTSRNCLNSSFSNVSSENISGEKKVANAIYKGVFKFGACNIFTTENGLLYLFFFKSIFFIIKIFSKNTIK